MVNMLFSQYNFNKTWAKDAVGKYLNDGQKVLVIPFSFNEKIKNNNDWQKAYSKTGKYYKIIVQPLFAFGIKEENIDWLNYFTDKKETKETTIEKINKSDVLFFTGGLPNRMMDRLQEFDIIDEIEQFHGIVIGVSAGALIQLADYHISPDDDYKYFSYNKGLNFINDFFIEVHYDESELQNRYIEKVLKEKTNCVYGITDKGGIIVDQGYVTLLGDTRTFTK